jgi:hypothetical protein
MMVMMVKPTAGKCALSQKESDLKVKAEKVEDLKANSKINAAGKRLGLDDTEMKRLWDIAADLAFGKVTAAALKDAKKLKAEAEKAKK